MADQAQVKRPSAASQAAAIFGIVTLLLDVFLVLARLVPEPFAVLLLTVALAIGNGWVLLAIMTGVGALPALLGAVIGHVKARSGAGGMSRVIFAYVAVLIYGAIIGVSLATGGGLGGARDASREPPEASASEIPPAGPNGAVPGSEHPKSAEVAPQKPEPPGAVTSEYKNDNPAFAITVPASCKALPKCASTGADSCSAEDQVRLACGLNEVQISWSSVIQQDQPKPVLDAKIVSESPTTDGKGKYIETKDAAMASAGYSAVTAGEKQFLCSAVVIDPKDDTVESCKTLSVP